MFSRRMVVIGSALNLVLGACSSVEGNQPEGTGGTRSSGGSGSDPGEAGGGIGSGGRSNTGGQLGAGGAAGGSAASSGGAHSGGGENTGGSADGAGGSADGTGGTTEGAIPMGNAPVPSDGCGKATSITTKEYTINSSGPSRVNYVEMPANYDKNKPYRVF